MASISSMKTMHGAFCLACSNRSRTREAPTPTNISTKSEPEIERNGTLASPATALASRVLPVPGGPTSSAPFGILAPSSLYLSAFLRKSTISMISTFASSRPATSLNVTRLELSLSKTCALALPTFIMPPPPPAPAPRDMERMMKNHAPMMIIHGSRLIRIEVQVSFSGSKYSIGILYPASCATLLSSAMNGSIGPVIKNSWGGLSGILPNCLFLFSGAFRYFSTAPFFRKINARDSPTICTRSTSPCAIIDPTSVQSLLIG